MASIDDAWPMQRHRPATLADDLLRGADAIAAFMFGVPEDRAKVYRIVRSSRFPSFKVGGLLCARRSKIIAWIEEQEDRSIKNVKARD